MRPSVAVVNGKRSSGKNRQVLPHTGKPEGQEPSPEESLSRSELLDELINNEILLEKAKKLNLEASDGEVEDKSPS